VTKRAIVMALLLMGCTGEVASPTRPDEPPAIDVPVLSWGFEPASADCNGWPAFGALTIRAAPSRSGAYSCKVCTTAASPELRLTRPMGDARAGRYLLTAWVRKRTATAAPASAVARIEASTASGDVIAIAPGVPVRDAWEKLEATLDLTVDAHALTLTIGAAAAEPDRCLLVDDVSVSRQAE
jgi:hypothetical protein